MLTSCVTAPHMFLSLAQVVEHVFVSERWGDGPVVAAFEAWGALCDVFVAAGQLRSVRRRALLLNPLLHQLQPQPPGSPEEAVLVRSKARPGCKLCMWNSTALLGACLQISNVID